MRYLLYMLVVLSVVLSASGAFAALNGPAYPAPGGNGLAFSGPFENAGEPGGLTVTYTGFDSTAYGSLYWGPDSTQIVGLSFSATNGVSAFNGSETMTYQSGLSDLSAGTAVWTGETVMGYFDGGGNWHSPTVYTRFTLSVTDLGNTAMPFVDAVSVGGPAAANVLTQIMDPAGFKANLLWTASLDNFTWTPALTLFNSSQYADHGGVSYTHTFNGGFYNSAVPEPVTLLGFGLPMLMVGLDKLRRLRK